MKSIAGRAEVARPDVVEDFFQLARRGSRMWRLYVSAVSALRALSWRWWPRRRRCSRVTPNWAAHVIRDALAQDADWNSFSSASARTAYAKPQAAACLTGYQS